MNIERFYNIFIILQNLSPLPKSLSDKIVDKKRKEDDFLVKKDNNN